MIALLWLDGCSRDEAPDPDPIGEDHADIVLEPAGALDLGTVLIPCDQGRDLQVVNRGHTTRLVDNVHLEDADGLVLTVDLPQPLVLHPGGSLPVRVQAVSETPVDLSATLVVHSDEGTLSEPVTGEIVYEEQRTETFSAPLPPVDVVLAVDHAHVAGGELGRGARGWLDALGKVADWRLILVTADTGCQSGDVYGPDAEDAAVDRIADHALDAGGGSEYSDALLELASKALAENAPTECNGDFHRDDAPLMVVAVSDRPDRSKFDWEHWVDDYHDYADRVTVSGVVDAKDDCGAGDDGYRQAVDATDGALVDLCRGGRGDDLPELARTVQDVEPRLSLAAPALADTLEVRVAGEAAAAHLADDGLTVILDQAVPAGTEIRVDYSVDPGCG